MRTPTHASVPALSALAMSFFCLFSQKPLASEDEIIVISGSAQREAWLLSPATVELRATPSNSILIDSAQLLSSISGVQADSRANFAQDTRLSIRGFGSRSAFGIRGLYLQQDGIPLSTPDGQGQLSSVLLDNIAQVEVLKGPLAALYGNAAGGVVSLYSREPAENAVDVSVAGSDLHRQYKLQADWVNGEQSLSLAAKRFTSDGFRPHAAAEKQQAQLRYHNSIADLISVTARLDYARDPRLQDPLGLSIEAWQQNPEQTAVQAELFDTEKNSRQRQFSLSLSDNNDSEHWQIAAWLGDRSINQRLAFTGSSPTSAGGEVVLDRQFQGINANYRLISADSYNVRIGASLVQSEDNRLGFVNDFGQRGALRRDQLDRADSQDLYARFNWQPQQNWQIQAGWRYSALKLRITDNYITADNPDDSGHKVFYHDAFAAGLSYRINQWLSWYVSAATGFESPTLAEVAYRADGAGVNLTLDASTNQQWESGLKWQTHSITGSINLFYINSHNELLVDSSAGGRTSYRNAAKTQRYGSELQLHWRVNSYFYQRLNAHYLSASFADGLLNNNRLPGVAKAELNWQLSYLPWQDATELSLHSHYRSNVYIDDTNSDSAPSALTFSASAQHQQQWSGVLVNYWIALDNITDKTYVGSVIVNQSNGRAFEPAPGRQLSVGLSARYRW